MKFELDEKQLELFEKWCDENNLSQMDAGAVGGAFIFEFTPTGIGDIIKVRHKKSNLVIDLTDWDNFG